MGFLDTRYSSDYGETWESRDLQPMLYGPETSPKEVSCNAADIPDAKNAAADLVAGSAAYIQSLEYKLVSDDHNVVRNPRGAITPFKLKDGKHVALLFYNNGHTEKVSVIVALQLILIVWMN